MFENYDNLKKTWHRRTRIPTNNFGEFKSTTTIASLEFLQRARAREGNDNDKEDDNDE